MPSARVYFSADVKGAEDLAKLLDELPKSLTDSVLMSTAAKAAKPIIELAKELAPEDPNHDWSKHPGDLKESIGLKRWRGFKYKGVIIGPTWPMGAHGHLVEWGTGLRFHKDGSYSGIMPAQPFMRPAWDAEKGAALEIMRTEIWNVLVKAVRRLRNRALAGRLSNAQTNFFAGR